MQGSSPCVINHRPRSPLRGCGCRAGSRGGSKQGPRDAGAAPTHPHRRPVLGSCRAFRWRLTACVARAVSRAQGENIDGKGHSEDESESVKVCQATFWGGQLHRPNPSSEMGVGARNSEERAEAVDARTEV